MIALPTMTSSNETAEPAITEPIMKTSVDMRSIGRKSKTSANLRTNGILPAIPMQYPSVIQLNSSMWP